MTADEFAIKSTVRKPPGNCEKVVTKRPDGSRRSASKQVALALKPGLQRNVRRPLLNKTRTFEIKTPLIQKLEPGAFSYVFGRKVAMTTPPPNAKFSKLPFEADAEDNAFKPDADVSVLTSD